MDPFWTANLAAILLAVLVFGTYIGLTRGNPTAVCVVAAQTVWIAVTMFAFRSEVVIWTGTGVMVVALFAWNFYDALRFRRELHAIGGRAAGHVWSFVDQRQDEITALEASGYLSGAQADQARDMITAYATDLLRAYRR